MQVSVSKAHGYNIPIHNVRYMKQAHIFSSCLCNTSLCIIFSFTHCTMWLPVYSLPGNMPCTVALRVSSKTYSQSEECSIHNIRSKCAKIIDPAAIIIWAMRVTGNRWTRSYPAVYQGVYRQIRYVNCI